MKLKQLLLLIIGMLVYANALAVDADSVNVVNVSGNDVQCLIDLDRKFTIKNIPEKGFKKVTSPRSNFGYLNGNVWLKFQINSKSDLNHVLELKNPGIYKVKLFFKKNGSWSRNEGIGDFWVPNGKSGQHRYQRFSVAENGEYMLFVQGKGEQMVLNVSLFPIAKLKEINYWNNLKSGFHFGLLFMILGLATFMIVLLPGRTTFYLFTYLVFFIVAQLSFSGYGYEYIWGDDPYIQNRAFVWSVCLLTVFMTLFLQKFLQTAKNLRGLHFFYNTYIFLTSILFVLFFRDNGELLFLLKWLLSILVLILITSVLPLSIYFYRRRFKPARLIFLANLSLFLGGSLFELSNQGFLKNEFLSEYGFYIGAILQSGFLIIALLDSYGIFKEIAIKQSSKISLLLASKNKDLQVEVDKRTQNVNHQKENLEKVNSELVSSINAAREIQNSLVDENHNFLKSFNDSFVVHISKSILSGDFYWTPSLSISKSTDLKKKIIVLGDTNTTGVPGAMIGILAMRVLETIIFSATDEDLNHKTILSKMDMEMKGIFSTMIEKYKIESGISIAFCTLDKEKQELEFSGANMTMFLRNEMETIEITGFDQVVGHFESEKSILNTKVYYKTGDVLYLFSDGIFGKEQDRTSVINYFISLISPTDSLVVQKQKLEGFFQERYQQEEQLDDITIIGIKL